MQQVYDDLPHGTLRGGIGVQERHMQLVHSSHQGRATGGVHSMGVCATLDPSSSRVVTYEKKVYCARH